MAIEDTITELIALCREDADSYRRAAEILVEEPALAHFFEEQSDNREQAANALEKGLMDLGRRPKAEILTAPPSEGWTRPATNETNPKAIIEACHESEERTIQAFDGALKALPEEWRWRLNEYSQHMRSAVAKMHAWLQGKEIGPEFG